jgi:hypothetical protein
MKKLLVIFVFGLVSLSSVGAVWADAPYVYISFAEKEVNLNSALIRDTIIPSALTVKVSSNCMHGSVVAKMSSLKNLDGIQIKNDCIFIRTPYTNGFISMHKQVAISIPDYGSHDIVVDFMVKTKGVIYRQGDYTGSIAFTVMPPA